MVHARPSLPFPYPPPARAHVASIPAAHAASIPAAAPVKRREHVVVDARPSLPFPSPFHPCPCSTHTCCRLCEPGGSMLW
eukprot:290097-Chlamydomonas_euryale.AAC.1